jgi:hypothetical protein
MVEGRGLAPEEGVAMAARAERRGSPWLLGLRGLVGRRVGRWAGHLGSANWPRPEKWAGRLGWKRKEKKKGSPFKIDF